VLTEVTVYILKSNITIFASSFVITVHITLKARCQ